MKRQGPISSRGEPDRKKVAVVVSNMLTNEITDPLVLGRILSFLDAKSLAAADQTCKALLACSQQTWDLLYNSISYHDTRDTPLTKKQRILRFLKQQRFARRMERLADAHWNRHVPANRLTLQCPGCSEFPDIERDTYVNFAEYDYFVRLSQKSRNNPSDWVLLWEGFVTPPLQGDGDLLSFDMSALHDQVSKHWQNLPELLSLWHESGDICQHEDFHEYFFGAFENVSVTITAMRRVQPWTSKLVIASRGLHGYHNSRSRTRLTVLLRSRNIHSHADTPAGSWVSVRLVVETPESETKVGKFFGVELALYPLLSSR